MTTRKILVVGSLNMDWVTRAQHFPQPSETVLGCSFTQFPGGKGANQAVAASRLGAHVALIGATGTDAQGTALRQHLAQAGVDCTAVARLPDVPTGSASITVAGNDNCIVVVSGANQALTPEHIYRQETLFARADVVLAQLEIPLACVTATAALAQHYRKPFILNPAPAQKLPENLLHNITLLTPNQCELATSLGLPDTANWQQTLPAALQTRILLTQGVAGACFFDPQQQKWRQQPSFTVPALDSTGAGDTFNGALAVFWPLGLPAATRMACAAAALACTQLGAQSAMPTHTELTTFLARQAG